MWSHEAQHSWKNKGFNTNHLENLKVRRRECEIYCSQMSRTHWSFYGVLILIQQNCREVWLLVLYWEYFSDCTRLNKVLDPQKKENNMPHILRILNYKFLHLMPKIKFCLELKIGWNYFKYHFSLPLISTGKWILLKLYICCIIYWYIYL